MKILKIFAITAIFAVIAHLGYCENVSVKTLIDGDIPADMRKSINAINNKLFESMKDNKPNVMINMFVEEGKTDKKLGDSVKAAYDQLGALAKGTKFDVLHEYYIDAKGKGASTLTLPGDGDNKFIMAVDGGKGPLYISLLTSSGNFNDIILSFVYLRTKTGWELFTFNSGVYKAAGKNPIQWYDDAKKMYDKGWDVPAMQRMQIAESFVRPAPFIQYGKEKELADFMKKGSEEASKKYKFPMKAAWVKDTPMIYGLDTQFVSGKLVPVVIYVTKYPLDRGVPIQEEADSITSKIERIIPGITRTSDILAYRAFSEPPLDQKKQYKYRSLPSKIKG